MSGKKRVTYSLDKEVIEAINKIAENDKRTKSATLAIIINKHLENERNEREKNELKDDKKAA